MALSESDIELNELDLDTTISPLVGEDEAPSVSKSDVSTVISQALRGYNIYEIHGKPIIFIYVYTRRKRMQTLKAIHQLI